MPLTAKSKINSLLKVKNQIIKDIEKDGFNQKLLNDYASICRNLENLGYDQDYQCRHTGDGYVEYSFNGIVYDHDSP